MPSNTLTAFLDDLADQAGEATAIEYCGDQGGRTISFAELADRSRRTARGLAELGIGAGDRVALWLPNAPAWLELFFACARLSAIVVAVNTRFRAHEVGDIVGRSNARALVMWPDFNGIDFPGILAGVDAAALAALENVIVYGEDDSSEGGGEIAGRPALDYGTLAAAAPFEDDHAHADAGCIVFTTSGTTSKPKFVLHPQCSHVDHARAVAPALGYDAPDAVMLASLPLAGTFGMASMLGGLAGARPTLLMPTFVAEEAARLVRACSVTHMNGSDEMYLRMLETQREEKPFPSLRCCGFAAFNTDPAEVVAIGDRRGLPLIGAYGMSEVQALFAMRDPAAPSAKRMRGGGQPVSPVTQVRVRDPDTGELLGEGEQGELEIKGPSMMSEYLGNPEATAKTLTEDGFIRSGDLGYLEPNGGFTYLSRMGDTLRLGGYLVAPEEISNYLEGHPDVAGAQVVGVAGARGARAVAFVLMSEGAAFSESDLLAHCAGGLARFKVPVRIFTVGSFPVTDSANGVKVQRGKLREMAASLIDEG